MSWTKDRIPFLPWKGIGVPGDHDIEQGAVFFPMLEDPNGPGGAGGIGILHGRPIAVEKIGDPFPWTDRRELHAQEFLAGVLVMLDRGLVDGQELERLPIGDEHGIGAALEEQPVGLEQPGRDRARMGVGLHRARISSRSHLLL